jgi:hypothetical protein
MIRLSRVVIAAGTAMILTACSEAGPTEPGASSTALKTADAVVFQAPSPSSSCTVAQNGSSYDAVVSWSGFQVTNIDLWQTGGTQPLAQAVLGHKTRKGSLPFNGLTSAPDYAVLRGPTARSQPNCVMIN